MKRTLFLLLKVILVSSAMAQQPAFVVDKESLLTKAEQVSLDSLLGSYHKKTGNLVTYTSDTADVFAEAYKDSVARTYSSSVDGKGYAMHLLVSKNHGEMQVSSNNLGPGHKDILADLGKIVTFGVPYVKERRLAEGFTVICKKAMEYLDALPPK